MKNEWEKQQDGVIFKNVCNLEHPSHLWAAKFEFNITFKRENFIKFKRIKYSNFAAHRWRYKHGFFVAHFHGPLQDFVLPILSSKESVLKLLIDLGQDEIWIEYGQNRDYLLHFYRRPYHISQKFESC